MRASDIDLDLLHCFLAVAECGGFTAAAKRLNLTQSAVSLKIQRLESLLGREVFARTSRTLVLTNEGDTVIGYARRLLSLGQEMLQLVAEPELQNILRFGVFQQFGQEFLPQLLSRFKRQHPRVLLMVEVGMTTDLLKGLEEDRFDLVLGAAGHTIDASAKIGNLNEEKMIVKEPLVWAQSGTSTLDLTKDPLPLVAFNAPCGIRRLALDLLERNSRSWQLVYSSTSLASVQAAVEADLGIAVLGKSNITPQMKTIGPNARLPGLPAIGIATYSRKSERSLLVDSLRKFVADAISNQGRSSNGHQHQKRARRKAGKV